MTTFTLEVRVSNLTAVHVYEKTGVSFGGNPERVLRRAEGRCHGHVAVIS